MRITQYNSVRKATKDAESLPIDIDSDRGLMWGDVIHDKKQHMGCSATSLRSAILPLALLRSPSCIIGDKHAPLDLRPFHSAVIRAPLGCWELSPTMKLEQKDSEHVPYPDGDLLVMRDCINASEKIRGNGT